MERRKIDQKLTYFRSASIVSPVLWISRIADEYANNSSLAQCVQKHVSLRIGIDMERRKIDQILTRSW